MKLWVIFFLCMVFLFNLNFVVAGQFGYNSFTGSYTDYSNDTINNNYTTNNYGIGVNLTQMENTTIVNINESWISSLITAVSNPFDQVLNTTNSPSFANLTVTTDLASNSLYLQLGEYIDNLIDGIVRVVGHLRVEGYGNFSGLVYINNGTELNGSTFNLTYEGFKTNATRNWTSLVNLQNVLNDTGIYNTGTGNESFNETRTNGLYAPNTTAGIQWLINSTGIYTYAYNHSALDLLQRVLNDTNIYSTFNSTYNSFKTNVSLNYSEIIYNTWGAGWTAGGNASWNETRARELFAPNSTAGIQYLINSTGVYTYSYNHSSLVNLQNVLNGTGIYTYAYNHSALDLLQRVLNDTGIYNTGSGNESWNQSEANRLYAPNTTAGIQWLINSSGAYSTFNTTYDSWTANATRNWTSLVNLQNVLNDTGIYNAGAGNPFNQTLNTTSNVSFYNVSATGNISTLGGLYLSLGEFIDQVIDGVIRMFSHLRVEGYGNFSGVVYVNNGTELNGSTFNLTYNSFATNVSLNYSKIVLDTWGAGWTAGGNASFNQTLTNGLYAPNTTAGIQWLINSTGIYYNGSTFNSTYESFKTNVSLNWTEKTIDGYNTSWSSTYNATYQAYNTTANVQGLINNTNIQLSGLNMTNNNVTGVDCIFFKSGGKICNLA